MGRGVPVGRMLDWGVTEVDDLVGDLGLGELEDEHGTAEYEREEAQGHGLPRLQGDESQSKGYQGCGLELETEEEGDHDLLHEASTCEFFGIMH